MSIVVTPGYNWLDGEVETATKLNLTGMPTISGDQTYTFNNGAAATPSINFTGSTTTGFYFSPTALGVSVSGVQKAYFNSLGLFVLDGSAATPGFGFLSSSTTGFFYAATGIGFSVAATEYAFLNSSGLHLGNDFSTTVSSQLNIIQNNNTSQITVGQDSTHNLNFRWDYNATPASAAAVLTTFGQSNPLTIQASAISFDSTSLASAIQLVGSGRVRIGAGADDGIQALQVAAGLRSEWYVSSPTTLTYGGTTTINFATNDVQTVSLTGNVTFATSSLAEGRGKVLRIICDGTNRNFTFPAGWTFVGSSAPTSITASKTAMLSLISFSTTDASVVASYVAQS